MNDFGKLLKENPSFMQAVLREVAHFLHANGAAINADGSFKLAEGSTGGSTEAGHLGDGQEIRCLVCGSQHIGLYPESQPVHAEAPPPVYDDPFNDNIDLTISANVEVADPYRLWALAEPSKQDLRDRLTPAEKQRLSIERQAALNIQDVKIPMKGRTDLAAPEITTWQHFRDPLDHVQSVRVEVASDLRWYFVARGRDHSGVLRGTDNYSYATIGVKAHGGSKVKTRALAEYMWLKAYYRSSCAVIRFRNNDPKVQIPDEILPAPFM